AVRAAGALLNYLYETQKTSLRQFTHIRFISSDGNMRLDAATRRSLELTARSQDGARQGSLLSVLDKTVTVMGKRCLKQWVDFPLVDIQAILARQEAVAEWVDNAVARMSIEEAL